MRSDRRRLLKMRRFGETVARSVARYEEEGGVVGSVNLVFVCCNIFSSEGSHSRSCSLHRIEFVHSHEL